MSLKNDFLLKYVIKWCRNAPFFYEKILVLIFEKALKIESITKIILWQD